MPDSPLVSIIVPVYNAAQFLRPTLDSICNQSYRNLEIILVNDGSKDESPAILNEYAARDTRIKVIHKENQGGAAARNDGLDLATGEFIQVLDADDLFTPDMVEIMVSRALEHHADIVICDALGEYHTPTPYIRHHFAINYELARKHLNFSSCCPVHDVPAVFFQIFKSNAAWDKLLRTEFVRKHHIRFKPFPPADDLNFSYSALLSAQRVSIVDKECVHYQIRGNSLSTTRRKNIYGPFQATLALRDFINEGNFPKALYESFTPIALNNIAWSIYNTHTPAEDIIKYVESVHANFPEFQSIPEKHIRDTPAIQLHGTFFIPYTIKLCIPRFSSAQQSDILRKIIDTSAEALQPLRILYANEDGNPVPDEQLPGFVTFPVQVSSKASDEECITACRSISLPAPVMEIWPGCNPAPIQKLIRQYKRQILVHHLKQIIAGSSDKRRKLKIQARQLLSRVSLLELLTSFILA